MQKLNSCVLIPCKKGMDAPTSVVGDVSAAGIFADLDLDLEFDWDFDLGDLYPDVVVASEGSSREGSPDSAASAVIDDDRELSSFASELERFLMEEDEEEVVVVDGHAEVSVSAAEQFFGDLLLADGKGVAAAEAEELEEEAVTEEEESPISRKRTRNTRVKSWGKLCYEATRKNMDLASRRLSYAVCCVA